MQTVDDKTVISGLRLYASDQYESEQNEVDGMKKGADSTGKMMQHMCKERLMICNEKDTDGRARVTRDEERVLPVECRLNRDKIV